MKTKMLLAIGLCLIVPQLQSQELVYNFSGSEKIKEVKAAFYQKFATIKITNINTFLYDVKISGQNVEFVTPIPPEIQALFGLEVEEKTEEKQQVAEEALDGADRSNKAMDTEAKKVSENLAETQDKITKGIMIADNVPITQLQAYKAIMGELTEKCAEYVRSSREIKEVIQRKKVLERYAFFPWNTHTELNNALNLLTDYQREPKQQLYFDYEALYHEVEDLYEQAIEAAKAAGEDYKVIKAAYDRIDEGYEEVEKINVLNVIADIIDLQTALREEKYFEVVSEPIQADGDFVEFEFTATPRKTNGIMPVRTHKSSPYQIPVKGGLKTDFSIGPTLSIGSGARDDDFFLDQSTTTDPIMQGENGILTRKTASDAVRLGLASMIHVYGRSGKELNWGWMLGVGVGFKSFDDAEISFYSGPTFVLGKRQKFMISGGLSFHSVERLTGQFQEGETYVAADVDLGKITQKVVRPSGFLSLSYAIGSRTVVK